MGGRDHMVVGGALVGGRDHMVVGGALMGGRDHMVVGITTIYAISTYHH